MFDSSEAVIKATRKDAGIFIIAKDYPQTAPANHISQPLPNEANDKELKVFIEYLPLPTRKPILTAHQLRSFNPNLLFQ